MEKSKQQKLPVVSTALVVVNIIVFLICTFTGNLLYNMGRLTLQGVLIEREYRRIIFSLFLHNNVNHIFNNMVLLFFLGSMIEKEIGHFKFGVVYFLSGVGGNLCSLAVKLRTANMMGTIGASGAIFGLDGMLLALILFAGKPMPNVTVGRVVLMIVLSLYSGFSASNVDNAAHVGGLITGFLVGVIICVVERISQRVASVQE